MILLGYIGDKFGDTLGMYWGCTRVTLEHFETLWDTLGHVGTNWDTLGHSGTLWNTLGILLGHFWDIFGTLYFAIFH